MPGIANGRVWRSAWIPRPMADSQAPCTGTNCTASVSSVPPRAAFIHERHRLRSGDIAGFDAVDAEATPFDHGTDRTVEVTAPADTPPGRRQPILPSAHALVGGQTVLDEQQLAARPQYAPHLGERGAGLRDRAQGPGRDDGLDAMLVERNGLGGGLEEADWHAGPTGSATSHIHKPRCGVERQHLAHGRAIERQGAARAGTDLEHPAPPRP